MAWTRHIPDNLFIQDSQTMSGWEISRSQAFPRHAASYRREPSSFPCPMRLPPTSPARTCSTPPFQFLLFSAYRIRRRYQAAEISSGSISQKAGSVEAIPRTAFLCEHALIPLLALPGQSTGHLIRSNGNWSENARRDFKRKQKTATVGPRKDSYSGRRWVDVTGAGRRRHGMISCQSVRRTHPPSLVVQESAPVDAVALCLFPPWYARRHPNQGLPVDR